MCLSMMCPLNPGLPFSIPTPDPHSAALNSVSPWKQHHQRLRASMSTERFDCHYCKESLLGNKYVMKEDTQYCTKCYENLFSNCCEVCSLPIGCNCKDLSYKDCHWHEQCFKCAKCSRPLAEKPFAAKDEQLLCTECYSHEYSSKCSTCKKTIMPGSRKMDYKGNSWHETCFLCHRCQQPIGTKSFIPKDNGYFCVSCFEKQFAYQCCACKKVWQEPSTSPLRSASGTASVSPVCSAPCL
ncbi:four and a half LIM domains protein 2 isoform X3 [Salmo trutta]|nr:four and a half LIM domains protein 2-like isoform X3 [Salmo trutta]